MSISQILKRWTSKAAKQSADTSHESDLVYLKNFTNSLEAEIARSYLDSQDIPSIVSAEDVGGTRPMMAIVTGGARLLVRRSDAEKATRLLESEGAVGLGEGGEEDLINDDR